MERAERDRRKEELRAEKERQKEELRKAKERVRPAGVQLGMGPRQQSGCSGLGGASVAEAAWGRASDHGRWPG